MTATHHDLTTRRARLVAALRSNEFKPSRWQLETLVSNDDPRIVGNGILGVATRAAMRDGLKIETSIADASTVFDHNSVFLPDSVMDWYGFQTVYAGYVDHHGCGQSLRTDFDRRRLSFVELAEIIESGPHGLFVERAAT